MRLTTTQRELLEALNDPSGATYLGGFDLSTVFAAERDGMVEATKDQMFPSFVAYKLTAKGRDALSNKKSGGPRP